MLPAATPEIRTSTPVLRVRTSGYNAMPEHQREDVGDLLAVARGRQQEGERRQQQDRGGKELRQFGGQPIAQRGRRQAHREKAAAESVGEGDAALARHLRQQAIAFDPQRDRDEMRRQHEMTPLGLRRAQQRQHRYHHRKQPDRAQGHGNRGLHGGRAGAERRDQNDLRRSGPDQERAHQRPAAG